MRRVIDFDTELSVVGVCTITDSSSVGIKWENGRKNIIIKKNENEYAGIDPTHLSASYAWTKPTKKEYVIQALRQNPEVFVFASKKELLTWFIKED
jgi:hypothetical protein